jgi:subtilisin family serine protease
VLSPRPAETDAAIDARRATEHRPGLVVEGDITETRRNAMHVKRWAGAGLATGALLLGVAVTGGADAAYLPAAAAPAQQAGAARTVTLITGDRVTAWPGSGRTSVQRGPGRTGVTFLTETEGDRIRVVPSDAAPLLAAGLLDARLFDVTALLEFGYDRRADLPLIVTAAKGGSARAGVTGLTGASAIRDLPAVGGVSVHRPQGQAAEFWRGLTGGTRQPHALRTGVSKVWLDGLRQPTLDVSVPQVGAPAAWKDGFTGTGVTVAVLDSGVDDTHADLAGRVAARRNFTDGYEDDRDLSGHGTHVASTVAGSGAASDGRYRGVAPGATLLDGKVCVVGGCAESWIVAGMEWAATEQHAKVVNLSLGGPDDPRVVDPVEQAVQTLSDRTGTLFVVAAGNTDGGVAYHAISSPGDVEAALTVGAVDSADRMADFSRRGPTAGGALKPDLTAPGVEITAARGRDAVDVPGLPGDAYTTLSGTSMATPHVAGAAALLAQRHPDWSGAQLKAALTAAAKPQPATDVYAQGAGRLDVARAMGQTVTTVPGSLSFGQQSWPHDDDKVLTREVAYRNDGATDVTLELSLTATGPDGTPTPAAMFTVSAPSLTVPAGGTATVTVTADTRVPGPTGLLGGRLTATAGELVVQTPFGVDNEIESYDVTLTHVGRDGAAPQSYTTRFVQLGSERLPDAVRGGGGDGTATLRLPKGEYMLSSVLTEPGATVLLAQPRLDLNRPTTIVLDGRLAKPVSVSVPRSGAAAAVAEVGVYTKRGQSSPGYTVAAGSFGELYTARIGPDEPVDGFLMKVAGQLAEPGAAGDFAGSPYAYFLLFAQRGRMSTGYDRTVTEHELATVRADFAQADPGTAGLTRTFPSVMDFGVGGWSAPLPVGLPATRIEYYSTDPGTQWWHNVSTLAGDDYLSTNWSLGYRTYEAGRDYRVEWNRGVFGASFPTSTMNDEAVTRTGDSILVRVPAHTDGAGRAGFGTPDGTAVLYRDGTKLAETGLTYGVIDVPAGEAAYRLDAHEERPAPAELSTRVDATWTFRSGHLDAGTPTPLPLWGVRFTPKLDRYDTAPAGRLYPVAVTLAAQPGSRVGAAGAITVEASFDDGGTWVRVPVLNGAAQVRHPAGAGFVSLRAEATDDAGNGVRQTVIHAYRYGTVR